MGRARSIAVAVLLVPAAAAADAVNGLIEETYIDTKGHVGDPAGGTIRDDVRQFVQRYRLALDRDLWPLVRVTTGGLYERFLGTSDFGDTSTDFDSRTTAFFANLAAGNQILNVLGGFNWREQTSGTNLIPYGFVSDEWNLQLVWKPLGLPEIAVRYSRPSLWDNDHRIQDVTTNELLATINYMPVRQVDLRYSFDLLNPIDNLHHTDTTTITNTGRATWDDTVFAGRTAASVAVNLSNQQFEVKRAGAGGEVSTRQNPIAGLSLVEKFPATPAVSTLTPNPALINNDTTTSAGINVGTGPALASDVALRDVGGQFADASTPVNTIWIWLDKLLPPAVTASLTWTVWQSTDNQNWVQVPISGSPVANPFAPRYEITIPLTRARYLKAVTGPLSPASTVDPVYRDVFVTEIQFFQTLAATDLKQWNSSNDGTVSVSARTQITRVPALAWDFSLFTGRSERPGSPSQSNWTVVNGLSLTQRLSAVLLANARVARQDSYQTSSGRQGEWLYTASLGATPLPTLGGSFVYSGRYDTTPSGSTYTNGLSLFGEAVPYRGISLLAYATHAWSGLLTGQTNTSNAVTISTTLQPHRALMLSASWGHSDSLVSGAGLPDNRSASNRFDTTATFSPVQALYLAAGYTRVIPIGQPAYSLGNGSVSFSPFRGGDLQVAMVYSQTVEGDGSTTRLFSPTLRWNIRRATLSVAYTIFDLDSKTQPSRSNTFTADLRIPL